MPPEPTYTPVGLGITDVHGHKNTTLAGVFTGDNGLMLLEIEEERYGHATREYAEVAMSLTGFRALRDLMTQAINRVDAAALATATRTWTETRDEMDRLQGIIAHGKRAMEMV